MLFGGWFGLLLLFTAAVLIWAAAVEGERSYVVGAGCCVLIWGVTTTRPLRLCGEELVSKSLFFRDTTYLVAEVARIDVGMLREGFGYSGYSGFAMVIESTSGARTVLQQSRYCGRRRLDRWATHIAEHDRFVGEVNSTSSRIHSNRS